MKKLRVYFFSCDPTLLPVGIHGAVLIDPPCLTEWFSTPYLVDTLFIVLALGVGILSLVYGLKGKRLSAKYSSTGHMRISSINY